MYVKDAEDLFTFWEAMRFSDHALREAHKESLRAKDVFYAIFNGEILEHYCKRKRVLILGPLRGCDVKLHVVCDYSNPDEIVIITVYIPDKPKWVNDIARNPLTVSS